MARQVIDLTDALPEDTLVRINDDVELYLPADLPIPQYVAIKRLWENANEEGSFEAVEKLYDRVAELFSQLNELEVDEETGKTILPVGPRRLGQVVVSLYSAPTEEDGESARPRRAAGTRSSSRKSRPKSRSSKS